MFSLPVPQQDYLQSIALEKTLVAAAEGLKTSPDARGGFDQMAIDCIAQETRDDIWDDTSDPSNGDRETQRTYLKGTGTWDSSSLFPSPSTLDTCCF